MKFKLPEVDEREANMLLQGLNHLPRGAVNQLYLSLSKAISDQRLEQSKRDRLEPGSRPATPSDTTT